MTFADWAGGPDDETPQRFSADRINRRLGRMLPGRLLRVCSECLAEDPNPYLRLEWLAGWTAVCLCHRSILREVCPHCYTGLRLPSLCSTKPVRIGQCHRCGGSLAGRVGAPAHDAVLNRQGQLLQIKRLGNGDIDGLGSIDWSTLVALTDVLLGAIWIDTDQAVRGRLFDRIIEDQGCEPEEEGLIWWGDDYGALLIMAWLFDGWPERLSAALDLLNAPPMETLVGRLTDIQPAAAARVHQMLAVTIVRKPAMEPVWRKWLDLLPESAPNLRARVYRENDYAARRRLVALAALRDGATIEAAAEEAGLQAPTVRRMLHHGAQYGLEALLAPPVKGVSLTADQADEIGRCIRSSRRPRRGRGAWRAELVQMESYRRFGVKISASYAIFLLQLHAPGRSRPRRSLANLESPDARPAQSPI